ncbi:MULTISPECIES: permease-like cell division protein FtsX [unclassified Methylophaga]|jgi:cell division transport system permease protein|uniref:permease-like cell division protein FtsX n=1 Tax=unclassified Methylophaga TaxID=2629249 RepID=UPI000C8A7822|nr:MULTISPECIES: permease-like cell division protein FtsX [unclassified Methylophaga]MAK67168.1 cell division protein [Methylophaga sp.]MAY18206.1 cell division protein [Methylophaga sp.]MBN47608.1 cell division protein [Methylophaga sp.]HAO25008.1 cell division protein [Methylophaga sp.]|tara:strand:- start:1237 stop:2163 length:927 start_codon:yes stop_codon:yes gene_type:complete
MKLFNIHNYLLRHIQVMLSSLGELWRQPVATMMTLLVIGIALLLPAGLYVILKNVEQVSGEWQHANRISLFLQNDIADKRGQQLAEQLLTWPDINEVSFQSAQQSLNEFREISGLESLLDTLPANPLPAVIIIEPEENQQQEATEALLARLAALPEVDLAQLDMQWLQRLRSINETGQRGITILAILLSLSVLLVIGNTIRLAILNRQTEIRVIKLVGGTNTFVRRPFLYTGMWYGLLGGVLAWITLLISLLIISGPIDELAALYDSQFQLKWYAGQMLFGLPLCGLLLGVMGAWLAVSRHLNAIEPS